MAVFSNGWRPTVEKGGEADWRRQVTDKPLRGPILMNVDRASHLMTDESTVYTRVGREFAGHFTVFLSANRYVRPAAPPTPTRTFSTSFKRGVIGVFIT